MQTNTYSQSTIKQILIKYIYDHINISTYNYKQLLYPNDLKIITNTNYIVVPCIEGYNYLFVVMKNKDRYYSYLIDRKMLKNNENQVNIDEIYIIPVDINFTDNKIYDGTIFEGTYHFTKQIDPNTNTTKIVDKIFIINDVYYFNGKDMTKEIIKYKYMNIESYIKHFQYNNDIKIVVNKYIELFDIDKLEKCVDIFKQIIIDKLEFKNILKGIYFYPYKSGTKLIYHLSKNQNQKNKFVSNVNLHNKSISNVNLHNKSISNVNLHNKSISNINLHNKSISNINLHNNNNNNNNNVIKHNYTKTTKLQQYKENLQNINLDGIGLSQNNIETKYKLKKTNINNINNIKFTFEFRKTDIEENYNLFLIQQKENNIYETILIDNAGVFDMKTSELCRTFDNKCLIDCEYNFDKNKWIPLIKSIKTHPTIITEFLKYFEL